MWNVFGGGPSHQELELERERKRQEQMLQEQLASMGLETDLRKWKRDQEMQEGLVNAAKLNMEKEKHHKEEEQRRRQKEATKNRNGSTNNDLQHQQPPEQEQQQKELSYIQMAQLGYQELVNAIIRPPRAKYELDSLGPTNFSFFEKNFTRMDSTLMTRRGYNLVCSHWVPVTNPRQQKIPVVIYMHGNASARIEVLPQLSHLLSLGVSVFSFDFVGSGQSDGDYVSLGYFEQEDLSCVVKHLRSLDDNIRISKIAVWGRSMGASTAIMYGGSKEDPDLSCMILDSSFCSLVQVAEELVARVRAQQNLNIPNLVTSIALKTIEATVQQKADFNIQDASPIIHARKCMIPALFVAGDDDDFIPKHHTERLYEQYGGKQHILIVQGGHNDSRPKIMFDTATDFLKNYLEIPEDWIVRIPDQLNLSYPPWHDMMQIASYSSRSSPSERNRRTDLSVSSNRVAAKGERSSTTRRTEMPSKLVQRNSPRSTAKATTRLSEASAARISARRPATNKTNGDAEKEDGNDEDGANNDPIGSPPLENSNGDATPAGDFDISKIGMTEERQNAIESTVAKVLGG